MAELLKGGGDADCLSVLRGKDNDKRLSEIEPDKRA
jgi:hypothetical protein